MIITSKRKLTSSVAVLCALMILIGIFPMNLFSGKKADAASITLESKYVYLDISNFSDDLMNGIIMSICLLILGVLYRKVKKFLVQI